MDTNRMFTSLFGGWLTAADKAAAATINYTKSTVMPSFSRPDAESNNGNWQDLAQSWHQADRFAAPASNRILTRIRS